MFNKVAISGPAKSTRGGVTSEIVATLRSEPNGTRIFVPASAFSGKVQSAYHAAAAEGFGVALFGVSYDAGQSVKGTREELSLALAQGEAEAHKAGNVWQIPAEWGYIIERTPQTAEARAKYEALQAAKK